MSYIIVSNLKMFIVPGASKTASTNEVKEGSRKNGPLGTSTNAPTKAK